MLNSSLFPKPYEAENITSFLSEETKANKMSKLKKLANIELGLNCGQYNSRALDHYICDIVTCVDIDKRKEKQLGTNNSEDWWEQFLSRTPLSKTKFSGPIFNSHDSWPNSTDNWITHSLLKYIFHFDSRHYSSSVLFLSQEFSFGFSPLALLSTLYKKSFNSSCFSPRHWNIGTRFNLLGDVTSSQSFKFVSADS